MGLQTAVLGISLAALVGLPAVANGLSVQVTATNLGDTTPGKDLWQYLYMVSGGLVNTNEGFTIFFDPNLYSDLQNPQAVPSSDWNVDIVHPDPSIPADGFFDALALVSPASLTTLFTVEFTWLGGSNATPGVQPFQTYACTDATCANVTITSSGITIPEPPLIALFMAGLIGLSMCRTKHAPRLF